MDRSTSLMGTVMTSRREVLTISGLGALGAVGLSAIAGVGEASSSGMTSKLAPKNTPVPFAGGFPRPPDRKP